MDTTRHTGRVVLVTGAASGVGRATALRFAREGAIVHGIDINDDGLALAAGEFATAGVEVTIRKADVTSQIDVDGAVDAVVAACGRVDVLANVAGITDFFLPASVAGTMLAAVREARQSRMRGVATRLASGKCRDGDPGRPAPFDAT